MYPNTTFLLSEQCPFKDAKAQVNCRRIKAYSIEFDDINYSASLRFSYHLVGKFLEDEIIQLCVYICKDAPRGMFAKSKVVCRQCVSPGCKYNTSKTFAIGDLAKHQYIKLREYVFPFMHLPFYINSAKTN